MKMMSKAEWEASIAWSRIVAGCVIRDDRGRYLLVQEARPKIYGLWNLPAGHVDKGESIEDAAVRETKEETGYVVELSNKIDIYHDEVSEPVRHAFVANIIGGKLRHENDEILDVQWLSYKEIIDLKRAGKVRVEWILDAITKVEKNQVS